MDRITIGEAVEELRSQIAEAQAARPKDGLFFEILEAELQIHGTFSRSTDVGGGGAVKFSVFGLVRRQAPMPLTPAAKPRPEGPRAAGDLLPVHPDGRARGQGPAGPVLRPRRPLGQPAFPWRGRITCSPAAGHAGSVDKTAAAGDQVAALFARRSLPTSPPRARA
jgi:hypothetical protein